MIIEAFLLGLSSAGYCVFNCAPVAVPLFLSEDMDRKSNMKRLSIFLGGRLVGYLSFGFLIGLLGAYIIGYFDPFIQQKIDSYTALLLGILLIFSSYPMDKKSGFFCFLKIFNKKKNLTPALMGLLTGMSFCPPFLIAAGRVFGQGGSATGLVYFFFFFIGTSMFMLPLGGFFIFNKYPIAVKSISRYIRLIIGVYYIVVLGVFSWI